MLELLRYKSTHDRVTVLKSGDIRITVRFTLIFRIVSVTISLYSTVLYRLRCGTSFTAAKCKHTHNLTSTHKVCVDSFAGDRISSDRGIWGQVNYFDERVKIEAGDRLWGAERSRTASILRSLRKKKKHTHDDDESHVA